ISLRPPADYVLSDGEEIIILAEDDSTITFKKSPILTPRDFSPGAERLQKGIEKELIIGWNSKARTIIEQYTDYILEGSVIDVVLPSVYTEGTAEIDELRKAHAGHAINVLSANPLDPVQLE